jgi:hypothetical protein
VVHDQHVFVSITGCDWKCASLIGVYLSGFFDGHEGLVGYLVVWFLWLNHFDVVVGSSTALFLVDRIFWRV